MNGGDRLVAEAPATRLGELLEKWAGVALSLGWVKAWVEGAIFPREMVFFLARCEEIGIRCIVESGRQDGYSTAILGEYARQQGIRVYSIDYEEDRERARRCRERLRGYPELDLLTGDATVLLGQVVRAQKDGPLAILVDGPKGFWAMSLMFASAGHDWVRLLALHNLADGEPARRLFEGLADGPTFYEGIAGKAGGLWEELARAEVAFCTAAGAGRSLERSSLGVMHVSGEVRTRLVSIVHPQFRLYQPPLVRSGWRLGLYRLTSYLFWLSVRLWR